MMNPIGIEQVTINGLFGKKNISLNFSSKVKIIVGENGLGKTTILNILSELFKGEPENIIGYPLDSVVFSFDSDRKFTFTREEMKRFKDMEKRVLEDLEKPGVGTLLDRIMDSTGDRLWEIDSEELSKLIKSILRQDPSLEDNVSPFGFPPEKIIAEWICEFPTIFNFKKIIKESDISVKILPTYRRIEADFTKIVDYQDTIQIPNRRSGLRTNLNQYSAIEILQQIFSDDSLMKFGMKDVTKSINRILNQISDKVVKGYNEVSTKMVSHLLDFKEDANTSETKIDSYQLKIVLERLGESMSEKEKVQLNSVIETGGVEGNEHLRYYLSALLDVYNSTAELDSRLNDFCKVINEFLYDKKFVYDESHIKFNLYFKDDESHSNPISLEKLSSGEKQLIALFAYAYFSDKKKIVYIIDEPELSLSLTWQKILLPSLKKAPSTALIIAATHSPFIFDNELRDDTMGSAEYVRNISK